MTFYSKVGKVVSDGAQLRENGRGLVGQGELSVLFNGVWLSIDLTSVRGSMLLTTEAGKRRVHIEADAYLPNGQLYPLTFVVDFLF